jgi:hypothetical protein
VLTNFTDSTYFGMYDDVKNQTLKNKYALDVLTDLNYYTFGNNEKPGAEAIKLKATANEYVTFVHIFKTV